MGANGQIPPATAEKLATPFPKGTRHQAKIDIAVPLIGNGLSPTAVFVTLKEKFPEASEKEITGVIDWVIKQNPTPNNGNGNGHVRSWAPPAVQSSKPKRTPTEQVEWWTSGSRCTPEQLSASSPTPIPADLSEQGVLAFSSLFKETDMLNIVCDYSFDEEKQKANPAGAGKILSRDKWVEWFERDGVPDSKAGAWMRINPCAAIGSGHKGAVTNNDITAFRYMLVEIDNAPIAMQLALYQRLKLPIAMILSSGGKSAHAWVKLECGGADKYKELAERILTALKPFAVDQANKNCSRLCRVPGASRVIGASGDGFQRLLWLNPAVAPINEVSLKIFEESLLFPAIEEKPLLSLTRQAITRYEDLYNNQGKLGVPYGVPELDSISGGMKAGQSIVVAGLTGGGKSTFGLHLIDAALRAKKGVLLFSLEMDREEIFDLIVSNRCEIDRNKFNNGRFVSYDFDTMVKGLKEIKDLPLYIEDSALSSAEQIRIRTMQLKADNKIDLVVVDYIQFVNPGLTKENREQQVAQISHTLRALAREIKIPMVVLSQLNDDGKLRESRVIAHNANVVLMIEVIEDTVKINVVKGRGIPTGEYFLNFDRRFARLAPIKVGSYEPTNQTPDP